MSTSRRATGWIPLQRLQLAILMAATLVAILLIYSFKRDYTVEIGNLGDTPFLSGFHADQADISYRYRWTSGHAEVSFPGLGSARSEYVSINAQGARPDSVPKSVTMSVSLNSVKPVAMSTSFDGTLIRTITLGEAAIVTPAKSLLLYTFQFTDTALTAPYTVAIDSSTFQPPGDSRQLGVKVDYVELQQEAEGLNLPPLWIILWSLVFVVGLYALLSPLPGVLPGVMAFAGALLLCISFISYTLYVATSIPPIAAVMGILGLLVWQRDRVRRWPQAVEALRAGRLPAALMATAMLVYAAVALRVLPQVDWIGHADYAENAVIARNLVEGKGLTVDYIAQFYKDYGPGISHPADTWPLLQPLLIAPFFVLFGATTWAAKLPNLFLLLVLAWAVFSVASRLWDGRVGLFAGLLALVHPYFFNSVLYPINDLAFTLIFFLLAWLVWRRFAPSESEHAPTGARSLVYIGVLSGLLVWSKPSGAVLLVGLGLWVLWAWWRYHRPQGRAVHWRGLLAGAGAFVLVLLPLVIRNLFAFGTPFFSTESHDAWILRYWPFHDWEDIYKYYIGSELPHPRWIVGGKFGYQNLVDAITLNFRWVWQKGVLSDPSQGDYVLGLLPLTGAGLGLAAISRRVRSLYGMVGLSMGLYALFVLLYWHFEGRYFQVVEPWLYMLLAWVVFWILDFGFWSFDAAPKSKIQNPKLVGGLFLLVAFVGLLWPSISVINDQIQADTQPTGFVTAMGWLKQNSTQQDVIMTRDPWELNWYTGRKAVMIPNDDLTTIERVAKQYRVTMLQLGGPVDGINTKRCPDATTGSRPALDGLYCGQERPGYKLVYRQGGLMIYRRQ